MTARRIMLTCDAVGGVWQYCLALAAGFGARGAEVLLVPMGPSADPVEVKRAAEIPGVAVHPTGLALDWLAEDEDAVRGAAEALAGLAASWEATTIQLHAPAYAAFGGWPAPVVAAAHSCVGTWWRAVRSGPLPPELTWRAALTGRGLARADAVIAPSQAFARMLTETYGLARCVQPIWNGRESFAVSRSPQLHGLTVGRLWDAAKNVAVLDEAARLSGVPVRAAGPCVGPNGATARATALHLLGTLDADALALEYARAGFFVSPARYEPFGLAVLEAASAGCPLILGDIPTFRELWDGAAIFVPPDDAAGLARAMCEMLASRARWGDAARDRATQYSQEAMVARTWDVHSGLARNEPRLAA